MICHFILYVSDQKKSCEFYQRILGISPTLNVPGMTEFKLGENCILGLMPNAGIKKLLGDAIQDPEKAHGIPRAELYMRITDARAAFERALASGAKELSPMQERTWGTTAGYFEDLDGHVIAFSD